VVNLWNNANKKKPVSCMWVSSTGYITYLAYWTVGSVYANVTFPAEIVRFPCVKEEANFK